MVYNQTSTKGFSTFSTISKLVTYTDSRSQEEEDLHADKTFDEPIDLTINYFSLFKIESERNN